MKADEFVLVLVCKIEDRRSHVLGGVARLAVIQVNRPLHHHANEVFLGHKPFLDMIYHVEQKMERQIASETYNFMIQKIAKLLTRDRSSSLCISVPAPEHSMSSATTLVRSISHISAAKSYELHIR